MFFTFMSLMLLMAFVVVFTTNPRATPNYEHEILRTRVSTMNALAKDMEDLYLHMIIRRATKDALDTLAEQGANSSTRRDFVQRPGGLRDILQLNVDQQIRSTRIEEMAKEAHSVLVDVVVNIIDIDQTEPWFIDVLSIATIDIQEYDTQGQPKPNPVAAWKKYVGSTQDPFVTKVPVEGLKNPLTKSIISRGAVSLNGANLFVPFASATTGIPPSIDGPYYHDPRGTVKAPSYLQRYYDKLHSGITENTFKTSECCGIFGVVLNTAQNGPMQNADNRVAITNVDGNFVKWCARESYLDYILFDGQTSTTGSIRNIRGIHLQESSSVYGAPLDFFSSTEIGFTRLSGTNADC